MKRSVVLIVLMVLTALLAELATAQPVSAADKLGSAWLRTLREPVATTGAPTEVQVAAAKAFQRSGMERRVWSALNAGTRRRVSWSQDGKLVAVITALDDDGAGESEEPATWILRTHKLEPVYQIPKTYRDVLLLGNGRQLITVGFGDQAIVETHDLMNALVKPVVLPNGISPQKLASSADESVVALLSDDGRACVWPREGRQARCYRLGARHVALSADGSRLFVVTGSEFLIVDAASGQTLRRLSASKNSPLAVSGDRTRAVFFRRAGVTIVDTSTLKAVAVMPLDEEPYGHPTAIALDQSALRLATLDRFGQVVVQKLEPELSGLWRQLVSTTISWSAAVVDGPLAFSPDGALLFAGPSLLQASDGKNLDRSYAPKVGWGNSNMRFARDNSALAISDLYLSTKSGKTITKEAFERASAVMAVSTNGRFAAAKSKDGAVALSDRLRPGWAPTIWHSEKWDHKTPFATFFPDGVTLLLVEERAGSKPARLLLFDARTGKLAQAIEALTACDQSSIALAPSGRAMVINCRGKAFWWDFHAAKPKPLSSDWARSPTFRGEDHVVFKETRYPDPNTSVDEKIEVPLVDGSRRVLSTPGNSINCSGQRSRGRVMTCHKGVLKIWEAGKVVGQLSIDGERIIHWALGPNKTVALSFHDGRTELHSYGGSKPPVTIEMSVVTTPDGRYDIPGAAPQALKCRFGNYLLPLGLCGKATSGLLAEIFR